MDEAQAEVVADVTSLGLRLETEDEVTVTVVTIVIANPTPIAAELPGGGEDAAAGASLTINDLKFQQSRLLYWPVMATMALDDDYTNYDR